MSSEHEGERAKGEPSSGRTYPLDWEELPKAMLGFEERLTVFRTRVPGGWLVYAVDEPEAATNGRRLPAGLTFIPDSSHGWDGNSAL